MPPVPPENWRKPPEPGAWLEGRSSIWNPRISRCPWRFWKRWTREKTGALILASCRMGCILAGAGEEQLRAADVYARSIGLAFQIVDDLLDVTGDAALLGKNTGMDSERGKSTYVSLLGVEKARETVERLTQTAVDALSVFGDSANDLAEFAVSLSHRDH